MPELKKLLNSLKLVNLTLNQGLHVSIKILPINVLRSVIKYVHHPSKLLNYPFAFVPECVFCFWEFGREKVSIPLTSEVLSRHMTIVNIAHVRKASWHFKYWQLTQSPKDNNFLDVRVRVSSYCQRFSSWAELSTSAVMVIYRGISKQGRHWKAILKIFSCYSKY